MLRKLLTATSLLVFTGAIVGCNTVAGAGKDVERGGEAIQDTAKDVQKKM